MINRVAALLVLSSLLLVGQTVLAQDVEVRDTRASVSDSLVAINYSLVGQQGESYQAFLRISTDQGESFRAEAVSGDVGEGMRAGEEPRWLQMQWRYRKRFPEGLPETLNYEVVVQRESVGAASPETPQARNVETSRTDRLVTVTYDLYGERGEEYQITLLVSASGGETFDYEPEAVSGDVGDDVQPGSGKQIRWRYPKDFPGGLDSDVEYSVRVKEEGGNGWLYTLGGVVLVGGGATAAAFLTGLIGGDEGGGYPAPPAPPGN